MTDHDLRRLVARQLGRRSVSPEHQLYSDLGVESMDLVNLAAAVDDHFGVYIPEEELATLHTVDDFVRLVQRCAAKE